MLNFFKKLPLAVLLIASCSHVAKVPPKPKVATIEISGAIDSNQVISVRSQLIAAFLQNPEVLIVKIDSEGGHTDSGFQIESMLENLPIPVICLVDREAYSMAFFILESAACDKRIMTKRSILMVHKPTVTFLIPIEQVPPAMLQSIMARTEALTLALVEDSTENMLVSPEYVMNKIDNKDWFISSKEAIDVGAVDMVVYSAKSVLEDPFYHGL